ncbi:hypothetical protein OESDEN_21015 [Oesophagostomum dentatum]|uniref:Uncharacterized protein n=1 Tax=Oesophagostomum dentatum TaxID=61180 RepID=A0A0B1S318_OESDE|nr:hypothetical protein OESDEN_21015 [Oesophagostomum dentatum]
MMITSGMRLSCSWTSPTFSDTLSCYLLKRNREITEEERTDLTLQLSQSIFDESNDLVVAFFCLLTTCTLNSSFFKIHNYAISSTFCFDFLEIFFFWKIAFRQSIYACEECRYYVV